MIPKIVIAWAFAAWSLPTMASPLLHFSREGLYEIRLKCPSPSDPCKDLQGNHTLLLMNAQTRDLTFAAVRPKMSRLIVYNFASTFVSENGLVMNGIWVKGSRVAELYLDLSDPSSSVLGYIRDPKFSKDIPILGGLVKATAPFFEVHGDHILGIGDIVGRYNGTLNGRKVVANIQTSMTSFDLMATVFDGLVTYKFSEGIWDSEKRVVMLWRLDEGEIYQKVILPMEMRDDNITTNGLAFTRYNGTFQSLNLEKAP